MKNLLKLNIICFFLLSANAQAQPDRLCRLVLTKLSNSLSVSYSVSSNPRPNRINPSIVLNQGVERIAPLMPSTELHREDLGTVELKDGAGRMRIAVAVPGDHEKNHDIKIAHSDDWFSDPQLLRYPSVIARNVPSTLLNLEVGRGIEEFPVKVAYVSLFHPIARGIWNGAGKTGISLVVDLPSASPAASRLVGSAVLLREALIYSLISDGLKPEDLRGFKANSVFITQENYDQFAGRNVPVIQANVHHESELAGSYEEVKIFDLPDFINSLSSGEAKNRAERGLEIIFEKMSGYKINSDEAISHIIRIIRLRRPVEVGASWLNVYVVEVHDTSFETTTSLPLWGIWSNAQ